jgi:GNAT superfamily N-acetyltransferase
LIIRGAPPRAMQIDYLANHSHFIPTLARWTYEEWRHLRPGDSIERRIERLQNESSGSRIPTVFVAFEGTDLFGSSKLVVNDMDSHPELTPWLAGVFVAPEYRHRGIGAALVRRVIDEARALEVKPLYLYTPSAADFYAKLNWSVFQKTTYRDMNVTIMSHDLRDSSSGT